MGNCQTYSILPTRDDRKRQEASAVLCSPFMAETNGAGALVNKQEIPILLNLKRVV
jgi:hypothetical protein